jgi:hypothetical protein
MGPDKLITQSRSPDSKCRAGWCWNPTGSAPETTLLFFYCGKIYVTSHAPSLLCVRAQLIALMLEPPPLSVPSPLAPSPAESPVPTLPSHPPTLETSILLLPQESACLGNIKQVELHSLCPGSGSFHLGSCFQEPCLLKRTPKCHSF